MNTEIFYNPQKALWENRNYSDITGMTGGGGALPVKSFSLGQMPSSPLEGIQQLRGLATQNPAYSFLVQQALPILINALNHPQVTPAMIQYGVNLFNNALAQHVQQEAIKRQLIGNMISSLTKEYETLAEMARTADPATKVAISKKLEDLTVQRNKLLEAMGISIETPKATGQTQETPNQGIPTPKRASTPLFGFVNEGIKKGLDMGAEFQP